MTQVYLIRHSLKMRPPAEGKSPAYDRMQPLSGEGEARARQLLDFPELRGADYALASDMSRSLATIRYLIEADNLPFAIDGRLREMPMGKRPEGVSMETFMGRVWAEPDFAYPGGEPVRDCRRRMEEAILEAVRAHPGEKLLIGSHGRAIGAWFSGVLPVFQADFIGTINSPDVFRLTFSGDRLQAWSRFTMPFPLPPRPLGPGGKL